jgi:hypothetical protein
MQALRGWSLKTYGEKPQISLWISEMHKMNCIMESTERQQMDLVCMEHIGNLIDLHSEWFDKCEADFKQAVADGCTVPTTLPSGAPSDVSSAQPPSAAPCNLAPEVVAAAATSTTENDATLVSTASETNQTAKVESGDVEPEPLSQTSRLSGQCHAVVVHLTDSSVRPEGAPLEPAFAFLGCFATVEDALRYGKFTAAPKYPKCMIDIVDMYEWIFPEHVNFDDIKEIYGNKQLNDLMRGRKESIANAQRFQETMRKKQEEEKTRMATEPKTHASTNTPPDGLNITSETTSEKGHGPESTLIKDQTDTIEDLGPLPPLVRCDSCTPAYRANLD